MERSGRVQIILPCSHRTIFVIGQVDTHTCCKLSTVSTVVSVVMFCHFIISCCTGRNKHASCATPLFSLSHLLLVTLSCQRPPDLPVIHQPATTAPNTTHSKTNNRAAITANVLQHGPGQISIENDFVDDIHTYIPLRPSVKIFGELQRASI